MPTAAPPKPTNDLAWTRREKRAMALVGVALVLLASLWGWGSTSMLEEESCPACLTSRITRRWGLGITGGDTILAAGTDIRVRPSYFSLLLPPGHVHDWHLDSRSFRLFGMRRYIGCNTRQANPLAAWYEKRYPFRNFLEARLQDGSLSRGDLAGIAALPDEPREEWYADPSGRALMERAQSLLEAGGRGRDPHWDELLAAGTGR